MAVLRCFEKYGQKFRLRFCLRYLLLLVVWLMAVPAHGHHMGRSVPIGYSGEGHIHLAAQVIASYFENQMGRETRLVEAGSPDECLQSVTDREFPMAVVPDSAAVDLGEGVVRLKGILGDQDRTVVLVIGSEARKKLEFSLVQRYMDLLSKGIEPADWENARARVEAGEGIRGVALDMLREADLL